MKAYIVTENGISGVINGKPFVIPKTAVNYESIYKNIGTMTDEELLKFITPDATITTYSDGELTVKNGKAYFKDYELDSVLTARLVECIKSNVPFDNLRNFIRKLVENQSMWVVTNLYRFMEHSNIPITPDGCFLAYKAIRNNWTDKYTGEIKNTIGSIISMPRNRVDDNVNVGCSYGYHVGSLEYVTSFANRYGKSDGDRIIIVKVDPRDVVCVPVDESYQKVRVCKYEVVGEYTDPLPSTAVDESYSSYNDDDDVENEEEDESDDIDIDSMIEEKVSEKIDEIKQRLYDAIDNM